MTDKKQTQFSCRFCADCFRWDISAYLCDCLVWFWLRPFIVLNERGETSLKLSQACREWQPDNLVVPEDIGEWAEWFVVKPPLCWSCLRFFGIGNLGKWTRQWTGASWSLSGENPFLHYLCFLICKPGSLSKEQWRLLFQIQQSLPSPLHYMWF